MCDQDGESGGDDEGWDENGDVGMLERDLVGSHDGGKGEGWRWLVTGKWHMYVNIYFCNLNYYDDTCVYIDV